MRGDWGIGLERKPKSGSTYEPFDGLVRWPFVSPLAADRDNTTGAGELGNRSIERKTRGGPRGGSFEGLVRWPFVSPLAADSDPNTTGVDTTSAQTQPYEVCMATADGI